MECYAFVTSVHRLGFNFESVNTEYVGAYSFIDDATNRVVAVLVQEKLASVSIRNPNTSVFLVNLGRLTAFSLISEGK
ncbi:hypothetical protein L2E82_15144 [Cichorium intybus]|uniref:Uncharacterized protein n=1 Tax=Cichorium intybus TaxID=13427 RepID=A0ACB9F2J6_CICIN|nr:hypothetical protein L2E82_15144 [Cichorium intybus]